MEGDLLVAALYLGLLAVVFAALLYQIGRMVFGDAPDMEQGEISKWRPVLMIPLLAAIGILGLWMPNVLETALEQMTSLFMGGMT